MALLNESSDVVDLQSETLKSRDSSVIEVISLVDSDKDAESDDDFFIDKRGNIASSSENGEEDDEPLMEFYPVRIEEERKQKANKVDKIFITRCQATPSAKRRKRKIKQKLKKKNRKSSNIGNIESEKKISENVQTSSLVEEIEKFSKANGITTPPRNFHLQFNEDNDNTNCTLDEAFIGGSISLDESESKIERETSENSGDEDVILIEKESTVIVLSDSDDTQEPSNGKKRKKKSLIITQRKKQKSSKQLKKSENLRPIVIDGSNVAFGFGRTEKRFAAKGIKLCVEYFEKRGHDHIIAFVPQFRRRHPTTLDYQILDELEDKGYVTYTPSRQVNGQKIVSYDDRYIVEYADKVGGVIVSRDNFRDIWQDKPEFRETIDKRLLMFTFAKDMIMFPDDPLGRTGPRLDEFLAFPPKT